MTKQTQYAEQRQSGLGGLAIPLLIGGGLWIASRGGFLGRGDGSGDGGNGGGGGDVPAGMASVGGSLVGVSVSQNADMSQIDKAVQSSLTVEVRFNANTIKGGVRISWPYYVVVRIGKGTFLGWKDATQLGEDFRDLSGNTIIFPWPSQRLDTATTGTFRMPTMRIPNDPGETYDVHVKLRAQESDAFGAPNGTWFTVGSEFKEDNAFKIVAASAPASVNGTVSTVNVSQLLPTESDPRPANRRGLRLTGRS